MLRADLRDSLRSAPLEFLQFLRQLNQLNNGALSQSDSPAIEPADRWLELAAQLRLIDVATRPACLTPLGVQICDGVKQYCNWLERPTDLPRGVTSAMLSGAAVLDIGCGVGCALMTFSRNGAERAVGVDIIDSFLQMANVIVQRERVTTMEFVLTDASRLPFPDQSFDFVFSRLALNYMRSDLALAEMARVAKDGASIVVSLNMLQWNLRKLTRHLQKRQYKSVAYDLLWLLNGVLFHTTRNQMSWHYRGAMHSVHSPVFHTPGTLRRELRRCSFVDVVDDHSVYPLSPTFVGRRRPRKSAATDVEHLPAPYNRTA